MRHSDEVFVTVLRLSERLENDRTRHLKEAQRHLAAATEALRRAASPAS
jgi:hypothetical protein